MLFTDPLFLFLLLPLTCAIFYAVTPRLGATAGMGVLLVASILFYAAWGWTYLLILACSITANFVSAYLLLTQPGISTPARRLLLGAGLLYDFGTLIWFKYRFYVLYLAGLGSQHEFSVIDIAIPIGISFYTFQQAVFLLDVYYRDASVIAYLGNLERRWSAVRAYVRHAFFVSFFAHLVIGPIIYLSEFQPQVQSKTFGRLRIRDLEVGIALIVIGLFKKVVLADNLATPVNVVFTAIHGGSAVSPAAAALGSALYYAQLYFDFSGYSDMALGTARVVGFRFPINFFSPLKSVGIVDFYRRWHMTLTRVISRFLYTPLSVAGTRVAFEQRLPATARKALGLWLPLFLNFEVIALWHGARTTFILFGAIHGAWYVLETVIRGTKAFKAWRKQSSDTLRTIVGRVLFTVPMILTFALFRSESVSDFIYLLSCMIGSGAYSPIGLRALAIGLPCFAIIWLLPNSIEILRRYRPGIMTYDNESYGARWIRFAWRPNLAWSAMLVAMLLCSLWFIGREPPFIYMGF